MSACRLKAERDAANAPGNAAAEYWYLEPGTRVEVTGLKARPDLNGLPAAVVTYARERERYQVRGLHSSTSQLNVSRF